MATGRLTRRQSFGTATNPGFVAVGDFNGDGKGDLVTASYPTTTSRACCSVTATAPSKPSSAFGTGPHPDPSRWAISTATGKTILVTADEGGNTVSVLLGNGNGTFQAKQTFGMGPSSGTNAVAVADFNGDGRSDLVTSDGTDSTASVLLGNGDGTFQARQAFGTGSGPELSRSG